VTPSPVLYEVPYASGEVRLIMGTAVSLFVVFIFGWWLPRAIRILRSQHGATRSQEMVTAVVALAPAVIGIGPLVVLIALIRNPKTYVTVSGVTQESVFHRQPVSFAWGDIAHVDCRTQSDGSIRTIALVATDRRHIELGNTGGVDFASMHELLQNQLGPAVVPQCERSQSR
jgi:hypothetical protein